MLAGMRMLVNMRREDEDPLRRLAIANHRSFREQGEYYLHVMIQQEYAKLLESEPDEVAEVA
jgi:hypothetical protein